jgi:hypothetical protein
MKRITRAERIKPSRLLKFTTGNISAPVFFPKIYSNPGPNITIIPFETIESSK